MYPAFEDIIDVIADKSDWKLLTPLDMFPWELVSGAGDRIRGSNFIMVTLGDQWQMVDEIYQGEYREWIETAIRLCEMYRDGAYEIISQRRILRETQVLRVAYDGTTYDFRPCRTQR